MRHSFHPLNQSPFYKLATKRRLATILGASLDAVKYVAAKADDLYKKFDIRKKDGGVRRVESPEPQLKNIQSRVADLLSRIRPPDYLFCPVKGKCYVSNAAEHRGNRVVRCLDIRKYFPSTSFERVFWFFRSVMRCSDDVAWLLAKIATYKGHLPTGSPLSPIMAYYAYHDVWEAINAICNQHGYRLTVYIDDVTVSGSRLDPNVIWEIKQTIHRSGLRYHKEKIYIDRPAEVTGVIVNGDRITVPNRQLQKALMMRRSLEEVHHSKARRCIEERLSGLVSQVNQVKRYDRSTS